MRKIRAFIIDDEISAINVLKGMLTEFCAEELEVVGVATNENDAIIGVSQHRPDVVFLDVDISPITDGIDLISRIPNRNFGVVITTAYEQYAIKAVNKLQPWGYLIKPVSVADLILIVQSACAKIQEKEKNEPSVSNPKDAGIIVSDSKRGNVVIKSHELLYCKSENALAMLHYLAEGKLQKIAVYKTLKELEQALPESFCRIHNNTLVNMSYITRYEIENRMAEVYLPHNIVLDVSVAKLTDFQERFADFVKKG